VTEPEWLESTDPTLVLNSLRGKAGARKLRLFALACCRRMWHVLTDWRSRIAVDVAERFLEGDASHDERIVAMNAALSAMTLIEQKGGTGAARAAAEAAAKMAGSNWPLLSSRTELNAGSCDYYAWDTVNASRFFVDRLEQCELIRDIFGNPFRPLPPRPEAIAPLGERIYAGEWKLMPILGEWLQENGYWNEGEHCLDPKNHHVKGCWVVDWVTGRE
jgi:hypothetical protein